MGALDDVKALPFDVFGTVVDYHASVRRRLESVPEIVKLGLDCGDLTEEPTAAATDTGYTPKREH